MVRRPIFMVLLTLLLTMGTPVLASEDFIIKAAEIHEHTIDALQTLAISAFVAFGFLAKNYLHGQKGGAVLHVLAASFLFCDGGSIILSYFARQDLAVMLAASMFMPQKLSPAYAYQALLLLGAVLSLAAIAFRGRR